MTVTVSVPGKIHLMGEHAVVYGKPAILAAINKRMYITVEDSTSITIDTQDNDNYVRFIVSLVEKEIQLKLDSIKITITTDVPAGYHLGTSAMVAVGTIGALFYFTKKIWNPERVNKLAYEAEKHQHGNPSGGDNTAVTFGGLLWYRKELEFLKSMWQLPFKPARSLNHFYLIKTSRPKESTGEMITIVSARLQKDPAKLEGIFTQNEKQTRAVTIALKEGKEAGLIDAIRLGEHSLERMGVVSKKVMPLIRKVERSGGAAKILGGGGIADGVGYILCYHPHIQKVKKEINERGYSFEAITLGEEGIRLEKKL